MKINTYLKISNYDMKRGNKENVVVGDLGEVVGCG